MKLGQVEEAVKDFNEALKYYAGPNDAHEQYKVRYNLGIAFRKLGDLSES